MTTINLIKKTFDWDGLLTVSEIQSIIIMTFERACWSEVAAYHGLVALSLVT